MRRAARFVANSAILLSTLLCIALVSLWVRSYWYGDRIVCARESFTASIGSEGGTCFFEWSTRWPGDQCGPRHDSWLITPMPSFGAPERPLVHLWTFSHSREDEAVVFDRTRAVMTPFHSVVVPLWLPMLLFAMAPATWVLRRRRRNRRNDRGMCPSCGYDLRATPERCPECGWSREEKG